MDPPKQGDRAISKVPKDIPSLLIQSAVTPVQQELPQDVLHRVTVMSQNILQPFR